MTTTPLPPIPAHLIRRIRACESEARAQLVLEHVMQAYATAARADLEAENKRLREALTDIGQYTGEGPLSTPWRDIVKACGEKARADLENRA